MEVSITQFRRELFSLVNQAMAGTELWVKHKGQRIKLVPENPSTSRLSRITPMKIINDGVDLLDNTELLAEMTRSWEEDWDRDFGPAPKADPASPRTTRE